jgi:clan AA aspartic protease (TIGR02281 family)
MPGSSLNMKCIALALAVTTAHALPGPSIAEGVTLDEGSEVVSPADDWRLIFDPHTAYGLVPPPQQYIWRAPFGAPAADIWWPPRREPPPLPPGPIRNSVRLTMNGVFTVPVLLNGAVEVNMMVDSGAAEVLVSEEIFHRLEATGAVRSGEKQYHIADGSRVRRATFIIKSLKLGDIVIENVPAAFGPGPLLLGQTFLNRLSSWSIDNAAGILVIEMRAGAAHVLIIR